MRMKMSGDRKWDRLMNHINSEYDGRRLGVVRWPNSGSYLRKQFVKFDWQW